MPQRFICDDHAARMHSQMARQLAQSCGQLQRLAYLRRIQPRAQFRQVFGHHLLQMPRQRLRHLAQQILRHPQRSRSFTKRQPWPQLNGRGNQRHALRTPSPIHKSQHFGAAAPTKIEIHIRQAFSRTRKKTLEH